MLGRGSGVRLGGRGALLRWTALIGWLRFIRMPLLIYRRHGRLWSLRTGLRRPVLLVHRGLVTGLSSVWIVCRVILLIGRAFTFDRINGLMLHLMRRRWRILRLRTGRRGVVGARHHVRGRWAIEVVHGLVLRLLWGEVALVGLLTAWTIRVVPVGIGVSLMGRIAMDGGRTIAVGDGVWSMTRILLTPSVLHHHLGALLGRR